MLLNDNGQAYIFMSSHEDGLARHSNFSPECVEFGNDLSITDLPHE